MNRNYTVGYRVRDWENLEGTVTYVNEDDDTIKANFDQCGPLTRSLVSVSDPELLDWKITSSPPKPLTRQTIDLGGRWKLDTFESSCPHLSIQDDSIYYGWCEEIDLPDITCDSDLTQFLSYFGVRQPCES